MDIKELQKKSDEELSKIYMEFCAKRQHLGFKVSNKQHKNVRDLRDIKKTIARILTLQKQRNADSDIEVSAEKVEK